MGQEKEIFEMFFVFDNIKEYTQFLLDEVQCLDSPVSQGREQCLLDFSWNR